MAEEENKEEPEKPKIPERWKKLNIKKMVEEGWRPRIKKSGRFEYLTMRFGNEERSLGRYSDEKWDLLVDMFPNLDLSGRTAGGVSPKGRHASLLRARMTKGIAIPKSFVPDLHTLRAWEEMQKNTKFKGDFSQFVNDIIYTHFVKCRGVILTGKIYAKPQPYVMVLKT